ncbi:peptidase S9A prolyl oligopeptidase domain protein beta-propeller [Thamnocephalis sphaerospora]|uniref:Prolyl endopeptidase n=1 Tax=Thamnocephalis sphaerospora TaxID=78915 RepID=A0A4P9XQG2_9FUNG|nr:peptidase S9A prolyl oligopeptidase domain protein beta-propeller [Thamnocephalis sphaerospora]|eukprot:RKP08284.1 peptidase S9A prolyl oligopeptidase domain protein beta-propeller [Thamnocephalis sphaerospora]
MTIDNTTAPLPPVAKKVPYVHRYHGREFPDDYQWLRDDARTNEEMLAYIKAENDYANATLKPTEALKDTLYDEFIARLKEDDEQVPEKKGDFLYYTRTVQGQQYPLRCRKRNAADATEEIILDLNGMGFDQVVLGTYKPSPDHTWLAYSLDIKGDEKYTVYFKHLETGEVREETIPDIGNDLEWSADGQYVFYTSLDDILRPYRLHRHKFGTGVAEDVLLFEEPDTKFIVSLNKSHSGDYLFISIGSSQTEETRYLNAHQPEGTLTLFEPREFDRRYQVEHFNSQFVILTNRLGGEKLINSTLCVCSVDGPTDAVHWELVLAHDKRVYLTDVIPFQRFVVVAERSRSLEQLRVLSPNAAGRLAAGAEQHYIDFSEVAYSVTARASALPYAEDVLRFEYTSLTTPNTVFDYNMAARTRELRKQTETIGYDPSLYVTDRIFVDRPAVDEDGPSPLPDDLKIPVTIVYRRDKLRKDGTNPGWLYGYGSYGITIDPTFKLSLVSLLDRGFVYAIAHIRGGAEWGAAWYEEDGKFLRKKNTFNDFVTAAEKLFSEGYTRKELLTIEGRSAGGLLMGAVVNIRPDLAKIALAGVPFVDVINTMMDESIPLTVNEYEEWGNPNELEYFDYMLGYSPYNNIKAGVKYPNLLIRAGLNDPRVQYWEPAKWCAKLRASQVAGAANDDDKHGIILLTKMGSGHFGASGRYDYLKDTAEDYAYIITTIEASRQRLLGEQLEKAAL